MKTLVHFLFSSVLALTFFPLFKWKTLLILAGGVLIDIDHYFWYILKYKDFNLINSYKFYTKNIETNNYTNVMGILLVFHTIEFLLAMIILSFYFELALIFTIGLLLHYLLDFIFLYFVVKKPITNNSILSWYLKTKSKKFK